MEEEYVTIQDLLEKLNINIIKVNSQITKKYFIFNKHTIYRYVNLNATTKGDAVDEIIYILHNKFSPNWFVELCEDKFSFKKGRDIIIDYLSYEVKRVSDIQNDPGQELFFEEDGKTYFNMFQNTVYLVQEKKDELKEKDWSVIQDVIYNLVDNNPEHYNWVINWLAVLYQYPAYKFTTSIIFSGEKGSGKGMLSEVLRYIFKHCSYSANSRDLSSNFNSQLFEGKYLLLANEVVDQDKKYKFSNDLKEFVTEKQLSVERKYYDRYMAKNYIKMILFSNSRNPISIEERDRRYAVFYSTKKIDTVLDYYTRNKFFEDQEFFRDQVEGFMYFLYNQVIDIELVTKEPIMTEAKENVIIINTTDFKSHILQIMKDYPDEWTHGMDGEFYILLSKLYQLYINKIHNRETSYNVKIIPKNKFGTRLRFENFSVYRLKSINNIKASWIKIPKSEIKSLNLEENETLY
jgi:hypothetical protein